MPTNCPLTAVPGTKVFPKGWGDYLQDTTLIGRSPVWAGMSLQVQVSTGTLSYHDCCVARPQKKVRTGGTYTMNSFVALMQSMTGRILRIIVGIALIAIGLLVIQGVWGIVLAVIGLVPLIAGLGGVCLIATLFGFTFKGQQKSAA